MRSIIMNNNLRIPLNTNKNIVVEFTNELIVLGGDLAVVVVTLGKIFFIDL